MPFNHPRSTVVCRGCHVTTAWDALENVDHNQFVGRCVDCHLNDLTADHVKASNACDFCHLSHESWLSDVTVDHNEVKGGCAHCHRLPEKHPRAGNNCIKCHNVNGFSEVSINHRSRGRISRRGT
jgi:hypothetical protein